MGDFDTCVFGGEVGSKANTINVIMLKARITLCKA